MNRTARRNPLEVAEIERHKYFLSEKAGHDVGWDVALQDWDAHHAVLYRRAHRIDDPQRGLSGQGIGMLFKRLFYAR